MSRSGKAADRSLIFSILVFVCIGTGIYKAREYASAAPNERTTTAHVVSVYHSVFRGLRFDYYSCSYNFSVNGSLYIGLRDCPQWIIDDAVKGKYLGSGKVPTGTDATVYYDPADPSVNSLLEFSAESKIVYRAAVPWIGLGVLIIIFFVFGRLLSAKEIGLGSEFAGLPTREALNSTPSPALRELYLEVVKKIHPDRAANEVDLVLRERLMKEANAAFERGDTETLRRVFEEYRGVISAS